MEGMTWKCNLGFFFWTDVKHLIKWKRWLNPRLSVIFIGTIAYCTEAKMGSIRHTVHYIGEHGLKNLNAPNNKVNNCNGKLCELWLRNSSFRNFEPHHMTWSGKKMNGLFVFLDSVSLGKAPGISPSHWAMWHRTVRVRSTSNLNLLTM